MTYVLCFFLLISFLSPGMANNSYQQMQKITANAMQANGNRMKNEAENMAGSKVPGYIPKRLPITIKRDRKAGVDQVITKNAVRDTARTKVVYDPYHPQADAQGMVTYPDVDPMVSLMNLQETKADNERAMKAYQMATDQRHRILSMINQ